MTPGARRLASLVAVTAIGLGAMVGAAPRKSIQWRTDLNKARSAAAKQNKILMVDFYADW